MAEGRMTREPEVRYAKTSDGVSIAYWAIGDGPALVLMPNTPLSNVQAEWRSPDRRRWFQRLAEGLTVVRYDHRGSGLSDRKVPVKSLDDMLCDLDAVVDRLRIEEFALFGYFSSGPAAIAYAARHPERVSRLILWMAIAKSLLKGPRAGVLRSLGQLDWDTASRIFAELAMGRAHPEVTREFAEFVKVCVTWAEAAAFYEAFSAVDATSDVPQVRAPTLVLTRASERDFVDSARELAAGIDDARIMLVEGEANPPHIGDIEPVLAVINEFLGVAAQSPAAVAPVAGALQTILFTDVEGSTALTDRLGDAAAREVLRQHERLTREALRAHGGSEVKTMGDGFMASFGSATKALECAIAIQKAIVGARRREGESAPNLASSTESQDKSSRVSEASLLLHSDPKTKTAHPEPIRVRIGLNAGEPIAEDEDLFGTAVIVAARIAAQASGGEILVSDVVRQLVAGKGFLFNDRGEHALKGFEDPVRVFAVRWKDESA